MTEQPLNEKINKRINLGNKHREGFFWEEDVKLALQKTLKELREIGERDGEISIYDIDTTFKKHFGDNLL